jgi:hypothetical protein
MLKRPNKCRTSPFNCAGLIFTLLIGWAGLVRADGPEAKPSGPASGIRIDFPKSDSLPYDKFGVFIGIDRYSKLPAENQLYGCVADATGMKEAFVRLGVSRYAMVTDGQATRQGIGRVLSDLVEQVKLATTKTTQPISVVITYAGHGCRVKRLSTEEDPNSLDSSWVAADSDFAGDRDVRGYELQKVHTQLAKLGAQVLIISDSCHSGSVYRSLDRQRTLPMARGGYDSRLGPQDDLFPQFSTQQSASGRRQPPIAAGPLPGFVFYSACGDRQCAYETEDDRGRSCGRLSLVMRYLLANNMGEETTYQELAGKVAAEFAARWPGDVRQTPEFHAAFGKADERFLRGGFPPAHANIVPNSLRDGMVKLTMGNLLGVSEGSRFTFYKNLDDLSVHRNPIATGQATAVDPMTCQVQLEKGASLPPDAPAALNTIRMSDFVVATEGDVPDFILAKLRELDHNHQIELSLKPDHCSAVLRYDAASKTINLYSPTVLPPVNQPDASVPTLRPPIPCRTADDAEPVASNLLYAARIQRMMTLDHQDEDLLTAEIATPNVAVRSENGVRRLTENQRFAVRLTNKSQDATLYATILTLDRMGNLQILYPPFGEDARPIEPGKTRDVSFDATIDDPSRLKPGDAEMSVLKVLATDQPIDFSPLAVPPQTGAGNVAGTRGVGGEDNAVFDLMRDVLHGGQLASQLSRGVPRAVISQQWATANLIFGVDRPQTK